MVHDIASLKKRLFEFMTSDGYRPLKDHQLAGEIGIMTHERSQLREALRALSDEGLVARIKGNRWHAAASVQAGSAVDLVGTLSVSPQGHGMVRLIGRTGPEAEVFIPAMGLGGALHGDRVVVEIKRTAAQRRNRFPGDAVERSRIRPDGNIVRIVERRKKVLAGLLTKSAAYWYVIPDHPRINQNIRVSGKDEPGGKRVAAGRKVVVQLHENAPGGMLEGNVIEDLGDPDAPGVDVLSILRDHQIATSFSAHTEKEAREHSGRFDAKDIAGRLDLRGETILTIDPADAKDHDDAVSLRVLPDGGWILGVHIADVSHFVRPNTAIDRDAREHGNSVYMVDRFIPMLPPYLTGEVCSLKAGRDRLAYSVFITYDDQANVTDVEMHSSVIHPSILLDYDHVQKLIVGGDVAGIPAGYHDTLRALHELATKLRHRRMRHGALDLAMPEVSCKLDKEGRPVSIKRRAAPEAYHLIEECMLAANIAVAERLIAANVPAIYRIHEPPADDQWLQMASDLQQLGMAEKPSDRHDIQRIIRAHAKEPLGYPVSIAILRNLKRAMYSAECIEHFGLAFERYTHFTSPIRRYSDLVVHRILKGLDAGLGGIYSRQQCEEFADLCSTREREADEAEEASMIIKRIQYYQLLMEKGETGPWPALITGGTARGLLVEISETLQRGFIPTHALPDPHVKVDRTTGYLTGSKGRRFARIGDEIPVELMRVDTSRRSLELRWVVKTGERRVSGKGKSASAPRPHAQYQGRRRRGGPGRTR